MACVVASVGILLHWVEIVVTTVVGVLAVPPTEVVVWALQRAEGTVVRTKADLRGSRVV